MKKDNLDDHLEATRGKVEGAFQKMMALTGNTNFMQIEMQTIWTVVRACITPIILYAGEIWETTTKKIQENQLKTGQHNKKNSENTKRNTERGLIHRNRTS